MDSMWELEAKVPSCRYRWHSSCQCCHFSSISVSVWVLPSWTEDKIHKIKEIPTQITVMQLYFFLHEEISAAEGNSAGKVFRNILYNSSQQNCCGWQHNVSCCKNYLSNSAGLSPEWLGYYCQGLRLRCFNGEQIVMLQEPHQRWLSFPSGTAWKKSTLYIHWAQASSSSSHPGFCTCSPMWDWHWLPWRANAVLHPFGLAAQRHPPAKTTCPWAPCCARLQIPRKCQRGILTCALGKFSGVKTLKL